MPGLDGYAALRAIGENPEVFTDIESAVAKAAAELVLKQFKAKMLAIGDARSIRDAVGADALDLIIAGLSAANVKSIVSKLDKHHPELKGSTPNWQRQHLRSLLQGTSEPAQKADKPKKAGARAKPAGPAPTPIGFKTEAMSVFRESLKRK